MFLQFLSLEYNFRSRHCSFFVLYFYKATLKLVFILQVRHFLFLSYRFYYKKCKIFLSINIEFDVILTVHRR